jgi:hypothetical protein
MVQRTIIFVKMGIDREIQRCSAPKSKNQNILLQQRFFTTLAMLIKPYTQHYFVAAV